MEQLAGSRLNGRGEVVLFADGERSQTRNRADALERLAELVAAARREPKRRIATKPLADEKSETPRRQTPPRRDEAASPAAGTGRRVARPTVAGFARVRR